MNRIILDFKNHIVIDQEEDRLEAFILNETDKRKMLADFGVIRDQDLEEILTGNIIGIDFTNAQVILYRLIRQYETDQGYPMQDLEPYRVFHTK